MDAIKFVANFDLYLDEIRDVIRPELYSFIDELKTIDPHDLVRPDSWFQNESDARGFVWSMFIRRIKNNAKNF
jgi:hypothetical protein